MPTVAGLDVGTTSVSGVLIDHHGQMLRTVSRPHQADIAGLPPGRAEQSPTRLFDAACGVLRELCSPGEPVPQAVGLTGQMHSALYTDDAGSPLTNLVTWQDRRLLEPDASGSGTLLDRLRSACPAEAVENTGCQLAAGFLGATAFWFSQKEVVPPAATVISLPIDWISAQWRGAGIVTDRSNAASTGLYDLKQDCWEPRLLEVCHLTEASLPRLAESGRPVGRISTDAANRWDLPEGLEICNAIGDNQAAILGSGTNGGSTVHINIGTGGQISWAIPEFLRVPGMETRYLPPNRFMLVGAGVAGGDAFAWVRRRVIEWLEAFGADVDSDRVYDVLLRCAQDVPPGSQGLRVEPYFRGTRHEPTRRGVFAGVGEENFSPGHLARAVLEGIAQALSGFLETASSMRPASIDRVIASGNAIRSNPMLAAMISRELACDVWVAAHREEAAYGAALLAGSQTGVWSDFATAVQCLRHERLARSER